MSGVHISYSWPAGLPYCTCAYVCITCSFFSVIVEASRQYNQAKAYDCTMGSEAVAHASCVEVTSFIRGYHAYQDV